MTAGVWIVPLSTVRSTVSLLTLFPLASVTVTVISVVADKLAGMAGFSDDSSILAAASVEPMDKLATIWGKLKH